MPGKAVDIDAATWARVSKVMERLAASTDLAEVLGLIIDSLRDCLGADRASVFQFDKQTQELYVKQGHGLAEIRFPITKGIAGESARLQAIINVPDCYADQRFNPEIDRRTGYRTRNMLTVPLCSEDTGLGGLEGVAQVLNKDPARGAAFDEVDESVARFLASQAAVAIRRARLIEAEVRKKKIEADLKVARSIQQSTFPKQIPQFEGYRIQAATVPADETGGDTFDLIDLRAVDGSSGLIFLMGDATGHGVGPALSAAQFRSMIRMAVRLGSPLERALGQLNAQLVDDLPPGRFITAMVGMLDPVGHTLSYSSAGQAPILFFHPDGQCEERGANGMPLGVDYDLPFDAVEPFEMRPGATLVLLSDGYYEAQSPSHEQFGVERVVATVRSHLRESPEVILQAITEATKQFAGGRAFDDDQTAIIIQRAPEPSKS
ncbi:MAG: SpoIIE family protein phosphatase [Planctomycetaceae bacterium]|jgi:sigma-B regulation protein RsbU (phosphoserine phosphatase)|nr:SpoIIE family protein phosphatase [Phycisphaerales bacterium]MCE2651983.1 SpoIIE family protein phosphatase [Planctomycetaceae bacterium]